MPSLGNLFVTIGAKTEGLDKGADKSEKQLSKLRSSMAATVKAGAALAAGAAVAGTAIITNLVNSGRLAIDAQAKLATALGGTIGGLRALEMAAGDAGVSYEELTGELVRMNARLGEAQTKGGASAQALERLGLTADYLSSLDTDKRIEVMADRMRELQLSSTEAAGVMRDLGVRNENLITLMRQGGDAIRAQSKEVRDLGLNLSMIDAAQVEAANDSLGIFGDVLTGIKDRLAVTAAPYITAISEKFREAAIESGGFKNEIEAVINTIMKGFGRAADVVQGLRVVFKGVEVVVKGFGAAVISVFAESWSVVTRFIDGIIGGVNEAIGALNKLPKVDITPVDTLTDSEFMTTLRGMGEMARQSTGEAALALQDLAMQPLPSTQIEQFLADVSEKSRANAEQIVKERNAILSGQSFDGGDFNLGGEDAFGEVGSQKQMIEQYWKDQQMMLDAVKNRYMTEQELERQHRETMAIIGEEFDASKFESEQQWMDIREQAMAEHWQRVQEIANGGYQGIQALAHKSWGRVGAETAGAFQSILGTMAQGSRKAFEISKAWAIADALISTFQGIAAGVKLGWPMAIPAVAWAAATGFAQVSAIRSQSFNGGGGSAAPASAGSAAPAPAAEAPSSGGSGDTGGAVVTLAGIDPNKLYDGRHMISVLQEAIDNGARLRIA